MINPGIGLIFASLLHAGGAADRRHRPARCAGAAADAAALRRRLRLCCCAATCSELRPVAGAAREQFGTLNADLAEAIAGIEVVKAYAQEPAERAQASRRMRARFRDLFVEQGIIQARYLPLLLYGRHVRRWPSRQALLVVTSAGAHQRRRRRRLHGPGDAAALPDVHLDLHLRARADGPGQRRAHPGPDQRRDRAGRERRRRQPRRSTARSPSSDVTFGYGGDADPEGHQLHARPGETIAIVGQTGSGKSTLTKLVNRTYDADRAAAS